MRMRQSIAEIEEAFFEEIEEDRERRERLVRHARQREARRRAERTHRQGGRGLGHRPRTPVPPARRVTSARGPTVF